jgi:hypothetical protein
MSTRERNHRRSSAVALTAGLGLYRTGAGLSPGISHYPVERSPLSGEEEGMRMAGLAITTAVEGYHNSSVAVIVLTKVLRCYKHGCK